MLSRRTKKLIETISNAVVFYNGEMVNNIGVGFYSQSEIDFAEKLNKEGKGYMSYGHYTVLVGNAYDGDRMAILLDQSGLDIVRVWVSYGLGWLKKKETIGLVMGYPVIGEIFIHRLYPLFTTNMTEYIQYVHELSDGKTGKFTVNHLVLDKDKYVSTSAYLNSNYTEYITQSANILHGRFCRYNELTDIPVKAKWVLQIEKEGIDLMPLAYTPSDVRSRIQALANKDGMDIVRMSNVIEEQLREDNIMRHPILTAPSVSVQIEDIRGTLPYEIQGIEYQDYMKCLDEAVKKFKGYKKGSQLYIQLRKNNHRVAFEVNTLDSSISVIKGTEYIDINKDWSVVSYSDKGRRYERHDRITSLCFATYSVSTDYALGTGSLVKVMKTGVFTLGGTPDKIDMVIAYK